jgi:hypothetical protein
VSCRIFARLVAARAAGAAARAVVVAGCALSGLAPGCARRDPPPVAPAPPLPADPEVALDAMEVECDALVVALTEYAACPSHDDRDRDEVDGWRELAERNFAASRKAAPAPDAQRAIAAACRKGRDSVRAAHQRCLAGPRPRQD